MANHQPINIVKFIQFLMFGRSSSDQAIPYPSEFPITLQYDDDESTLFEVGTQPGVFLFDSNFWNDNMATFMPEGRLTWNHDNVYYGNTNLNEELYERDGKYFYRGNTVKWLVKDDPMELEQYFSALFDYPINAATLAALMMTGKKRYMVIKHDKEKIFTQGKHPELIPHTFMDGDFESGDVALSVIMMDRNGTPTNVVFGGGWHSQTALIPAWLLNQGNQNHMVVGQDSVQMRGVELVQPHLKRLNTATFDLDKYLDGFQDAVRDRVRMACELDCYITGRKLDPKSIRLGAYAEVTMKYDESQTYTDATVNWNVLSPFVVFRAQDWPALCQRLIGRGGKHSSFLFSGAQILINGTDWSEEIVGSNGMQRAFGGGLHKFQKTMRDVALEDKGEHSDSE